MSFRECIMVRLFTRICFDFVGQSLYFILLCYHIMNNTTERDAMSLWMRAQAPPHRAEYGCLRSFVSALRSNSHQTFFYKAVQLCYAWQIERSLFWHASSLFAYDVKRRETARSVSKMKIRSRKFGIEGFLYRDKVLAGGVPMCNAKQPTSNANY